MILAWVAGMDNGAMIFEVVLDGQLLKYEVNELGTAHLLFSRKATEAERGAKCPVCCGKGYMR